MMGKIASAIVAAILAAGTLWLPAPARAENSQIAAGVVGGLIGGALLGGALAARPAPPPVHYAPGRSTSKSPPVAWFASVTGMDTAGNFAKSRSAIDGQPTFFN